jgi:hypothetical protein
MGKILILLLFGAGSAVWAKPQSMTVEFGGAGVHFIATHSKKEFIYTDSMGTQKIDLKKCNQKGVDDFWNKIVANAKMSKGKLPKEKAWVKIDGVKGPVFSFQPNFSFLIRVPKKIPAVFAEAGLRCKKK